MSEYETAPLVVRVPSSTKAQLTELARASTTDR
jgi:hypothetical protein